MDCKCPVAVLYGFIIGISILLEDSFCSNKKVGRESLFWRNLGSFPFWRLWHPIIISNPTYPFLSLSLGWFPNGKPWQTVKPINKRVAFKIVFFGSCWVGTSTTKKLEGRPLRETPRGGLRLCHRTRNGLPAFQTQTSCKELWDLNPLYSSLEHFHEAFFLRLLASTATWKNVGVLPCCVLLAPSWQNDQVRSIEIYCCFFHSTVCCNRLKSSIEG